VLVARLAVQNLALNIRRTFLVGSLIAMCVLVAIAGNSLFVSAVEGLRRTFI
jgi:hypothetical protein